jgi:4-hydroxybutyrate CoA-transferase
MHRQEHILHNTTTATQAAAQVRSGDRVVVGHAAGEPAILTDALTARAAELRDVEIVHMVALGECPYCRPEYDKSFRFNGLYLSKPTRDAVAEGRADFTTIFFSQIPMLLRHAEFPTDIAMITVSPPDGEGRVSLGISVDYTLQAALSAKKTIAVVNRNMPYIGGGALLDIRDIDMFVFADVPLLESLPLTPGGVEQAIGRHIAELIPDGACLQLGIGGIPDAVLSALDDKKDLGIHSEMISDGVMRLVEKGVITGARKTLHPGKIIITFAMGTAAFYKWLDHNCVIEGYPVDYVNDPHVIGQNDALVSINSALSVDLLGQVAADAVGSRQFSAVGGQLDFVRGSRFSRGGHSVIAMPSTAAKGLISRICGVFPPGQAITTTRNDVDYIVTEHGVAALWGKTGNKRAEALVAVAAPEFREQLAREARDVYGFQVKI